VDICCAFVRARGYDLRFALEPKPNEPRGNILLPTVGHALAFVSQLEWPEMVGLNPEFAHETMSGLSFHHAIAQTLWQGKLFHIDLNAQVIGKYDQDFRFGSEGIRDAFYVVKLLEDAQWPGTRHFDAHAYRTESAEGVWDFARGCMRTYLILRDKARRFHEDAEIQAALADAMVDAINEPAIAGPATPDAIGALRRGPHDVEAMAARGYGHERLDQLVTELLLGTR
jgi:xylose isomerase